MLAYYGQNKSLVPTHSEQLEKRCEHLCIMQRFYSALVDVAAQTEEPGIALHFPWKGKNTRAIGMYSKPRWDGWSIIVRGSETALHFQYSKGKRKNIFLLSPKITFQASRVNRVWPERKALLKVLELLQEEAWRSGRTECQAATQPEAQAGRKPTNLAGSIVLWILTLQICSPLSHYGSVNLGKPSSPSSPLAKQGLIPFEQYRYNLLEDEESNTICR